MSDKPYGQLWEIDQLVRGAKPSAMIDGTRLKIEFVSGFEKFNTRPYHNHESWGQGWRITDPETGVQVEREDLDDAVRAWLKLNRAYFQGERPGDATSEGKGEEADRR